MSIEIKKIAKNIMLLAGIPLVIGACSKSSDKTTQNGDPLPVPTPVVKPPLMRVVHAYDRSEITPGNAAIPNGYSFYGSRLPRVNYLYAADELANDSMSIPNAYSMVTWSDAVQTASQPKDLKGINSVFNATPADSVLVMHPSHNRETSDTLHVYKPSAVAYHVVKGNKTYSELNNYAVNAKGKNWYRSSTPADTVPVKPPALRLYQLYQQMAMSLTGASNNDVDSIQFTLSNGQSNSQQKKTLKNNPLGATKLKMYNGSNCVSSTDTVKKVNYPVGLSHGNTAFYASPDDTFEVRTPAVDPLKRDTVRVLLPAAGGMLIYDGTVSSGKAALLMNTANSRRYNLK